MIFDTAQRHQLLSLARQSIELGLNEGWQATCPQLSHAELAMRRSTFVTLQIRGVLRGCCGSIHPQRSLAEDLWRNAWASAFSDPRFSPLTAVEYPGLEVHVSVLSELEPLGVASEEELIRSLRPDSDGLLLQLDGTQATFLPAVWEQLTDPVIFLRQLKRKAGWREDFWSPQIQVFRYTTESFGETLCEGDQ